VCTGTPHLLRHGGGPVTGIQEPVTAEGRRVLARRYPRLAGRAAWVRLAAGATPDIIATRRWRDRWPAVDQGPVLGDPPPAN